MQWLLDIIFPPREDEKILRSVSEDEFHSFANPQLIPITRPHTIALLPFSEARVRAAIHEAKYRGNEKAFDVLAAILTEYLRDHDDVRLPKSHIVVVPIPLGRERHKERGFNQIEEIINRTTK